MKSHTYATGRLLKPRRGCCHVSPGLQQSPSHAAGQMAPKTPSQTDHNHSKVVSSAPLHAIAAPRYATPRPTAPHGASCTARQLRRAQVPAPCTAVHRTCIETCTETCMKTCTETCMETCACPCIRPCMCVSCLCVARALTTSVRDGMLPV